MLCNVSKTTVFHYIYIVYVELLIIYTNMYHLCNAYGSANQWRITNDGSIKKDWWLQITIGGLQIADHQAILLLTDVMKATCHWDRFQSHLITGDITANNCISRASEICRDDDYEGVWYYAMIRDYDVWRVFRNINEILWEYITENYFIKILVLYNVTFIDIYFYSLIFANIINNPIDTINIEIYRDKFIEKTKRYSSKCHQPWTCHRSW